MLGTIIEQNGDGLLEDSHMPVRWPLHIDGAVRQCCIHTLQGLDDMLSEYDMKRDSVEINHDAPHWSHYGVWNRRYMEPKPGHTLRQLCHRELSTQTVPSSARWERQQPKMFPHKLAPWRKEP